MPSYEEETDPKLKKMIDFMESNNSKFQLTPEEVFDDPRIEEEQKLLNNQEYTKVMAMYNEWLKDNPVKLAILMPTYDGNVRIELLSNLLLAFKPEHRMFFTIGHNIDAQRNDLVMSALTWEECTHVLFIDGDTVLPPYGIMRLLMRDKDIVSGYYMQNQPPFSPMVIKRPPHPKTGEKLVNFFPNLFEKFNLSLLKADASGAGCLLIKRDVFKHLKLPFFQATMLEESDYRKVMGEDVYFFDKATKLGYEVFVDMSVKCEHITGRNSFPSHFITDNLRRGDNSSSLIKRYNDSAMLYFGGYDLAFFNDLLQKERERIEKKAIKKQEEQKNESQSNEDESRSETS